MYGTRVKRSIPILKIDILASITRFERSRSPSLVSLNVLNGTAVVERLERLERASIDGVASFFLAVAFWLEKPTRKLLNDAFYAMFYRQIKMSSWSDPD
jgi:hypothetical protein